MSNLSNVIQNGQSLILPAGSAAIPNQSLIQCGGPGNEAWPVTIIDRAAVSAIGATTVTSTGGGAVNNYMRWGTALDVAGNSYVLGPNSASQGVKVTKVSPAGNALGSLSVDVTAHAMICMRLCALTNGTFAATYIDSTTGGVRFAIFDAGLNLVTAPTAVATGFVSGAVAYADSTALVAGGFAVTYLNAAGSAVTLQTYSNAGSAVLAATSIQALTGTTALAYLRIEQLGNGNLIVSMRTTMTPVGTSFVIVTTAGANVKTNTVVDATATPGFLGLSVIAASGFAIAVMDGTNVKAAVYNQAGTQQGPTYSSANTLNNTTYAQFKLANDGLNYYFSYIQSAGGLTIVQLASTGAQGGLTANLVPATFTNTASLDVSICNNIAVALVASTTTGGRAYLPVQLPDAFLGVIDPTALSASATAIGSAAGTTGSYWPVVRALGDFSALMLFDQQATANQFFSIVKFSASSIQGVAQNSIAAGAPGTALTINPGSGSYPCTAMMGTNALAFDHSAAAIPGNRGVVFYEGVTLSAPATSQAVGANGSPTGYIGGIVSGVGGTVNFNPAEPALVYIYYNTTSSFTLTCTINGGPSFTPILQPNNPASGTSFSSPITVGAGQSLAITATGAVTVAVFAQRIN